MDETTLRDLLLQSRFCYGDSARKLEKEMAAHQALDDRWIHEAAEAFHVPAKKLGADGNSKNKIYKRQADLANDVLMAARKAHPPNLTLQ